MPSVPSPDVEGLATLGSLKANPLSTAAAMEARRVMRFSIGVPWHAFAFCLYCLFCRAVHYRKGSMFVASSHQKQARAIGPPAAEYCANTPNRPGLQPPLVFSGGGRLSFTVRQA